MYMLQQATFSLYARAYWNQVIKNVLLCVTVVMAETLLFLICELNFGKSLRW